MVSKSHAKRRQDIKTKLMAAIAMLLVSSIMMVSSTYAWFTLSTAPEVTGIQTSVGANGNLEIALMPKTGGVDAISSAVGDSIAAIEAKNVTWGNLVDLENSNVYGLDQITLYPAALNTTAAGGIAAAMLKTPAYGADGRISDLKSDTVTSTFDATEKNFPQNTEYGVRAVGTASGMTDRQLAYRNARSAANTAMSMAKTTASQSLNENGASLANIAVSHAANEGKETYTAADIDKLEAIVNDLLGVHTETVNKTGVIEYIEDAYLNYIVALGASASSGIADDRFKVFQSAVTGAADVYAAAGLCEANGVTLPASITGPLAALEATKADVTAARTGLAGITATEDIGWNDFSNYLTLLADMNAMKINGYAASTFRDNMSNIVNGVATNGLTVSIATGGGVYADIADHCGDFTASITIEEVEYNGLKLNNMTARMKTETTVNPVYLSVLSAAVESAGSPTGEGGQTMPISDFYGYIIDLAFRTNAAESNLLLQTEAADRIYSENAADAETMGHGSTMTFTSTTTDFTVDQLKNLMGAIRVVFFTPSENNTILGIAKLDLTDGNYTVTGGNTITAKLYLYGEEKYTPKTVTADTFDGLKSSLYIEVDGVKTLLGADATFDESATYYTYTPAGKLTDNDAVITALTQNTAQAVSVLVYLDGEHITNADVAATGASSMTGTLNLQFASSANLVPMNYTPLMSQGGSTNPDNENQENG